ncbi:MAG: ABC transporter permease, partial [Lachnospiraceae bacterium]|nr:ABC transporter permease [Lachnospiraceae bacterium]
MGVKMRYATKKLISMLITLLAVSFLVFLSFDLIAGDPATTILGTQATPARLAELREQMGLNDPFLVRYGRWLIDFLGGDMGESVGYRIPVTEMVADKLPITLTMTILAFMMIGLLAVPVGIYTARHAGRTIDRIMMTVNQIIMAFPPFFTGIIITMI